VVLLFTQAQLIAYLSCALLWTAAALIAAMSVFTQRLIQKLKPVIEVATRLQQRARDENQRDR
jgi:hypothetical protein